MKSKILFDGMDRRAFLKNTTLTSIGALVTIAGIDKNCLAAFSAEKTFAQSCDNSKANIILILMDQFRPDHLNKKYTPNLCRLAGEGVRFTNAYTPSPLCQPARNSIITGLYPSQTGVCGNQSKPINSAMREDTFMRHLQKNGYTTALIGKHHYMDRWGLDLDVVEEDSQEVKNYGFDHVTQCLDVWEHARYNDDDYIYYLRQKGLEKKFKANLSESVKKGIHPLAADDTEDGFIGNSAVKFINDYDSEKPLYLNLSFIGPHPPYISPGISKFTPEKTKAALGVETDNSTKCKRAYYANYCVHLDNYVGKFVKALKDKGLYDNSVIIFTSDHGDCLGDFGIWGKRFFYEQSVAVPLFMCGKNIPGENRDNGERLCKALVSTLDIYPTIIDLAGIKSNVTEERPGKNLLDIIAGKPSAYRRAVFSQLGTLAMIRTSKWKMVFDPEQGGICYLFNLNNDPSELKNLAGVPGYEGISAKLSKHLLSFYVDLHQFTHIKEQQRLQKVRVLFDE